MEGSIDEQETNFGETNFDETNFEEANFDEANRDDVNRNEVGDVLDTSDTFTNPNRIRTIPRSETVIMEDLENARIPSSISVMSIDSVSNHA